MLLPTERAEGPEVEAESDAMLRHFSRDAQVAFQLGISDINDVTDVLNSTATEELAHQLRQLSKRLLQVAHTGLRLTRQLEFLLAARSVLANKENAAQKVLLERIMARGGDNSATADELLMLANAYAFLCQHLDGGTVRPDRR